MCIVGLNYFVIQKDEQNLQLIICYTTDKKELQKNKNKQTQQKLQN